MTFRYITQTTRINPRFSRGLLALLDPVSGRDLLSHSGSPTITGTRITTNRNGIARGYGATVGVGSTDSVRFASTIPHSSSFGLGGAVSFACRLVVRGSGGSGFGRILHKGAAFGATGSLQFYHSTATYNPGVSLLVFDSGGSAQVDRTWPIPAYGTPMTMVFVVYGGGGGSANLWINGSLVTTFSAAGTAGGVGANSTDPWFVGNRGDGLRNFDGSIGQVPIWNRALTNGEAQAISANFDSLFYVPPQPLFVLISNVEITVARPSGDRTTAGWTAQPPGTLFTTVNEVVADDLNYVISPNSADPSTQPLEYDLNEAMPAGNWDIKFRPRKTSGNMGVIVTLSGPGGDVGTASTTVTGSTFSEVILPVTTTGTADKIKFQVYQGGLP